LNSYDDSFVYSAASWHPFYAEQMADDRGQITDDTTSVFLSSDLCLLKSEFVVSVAQKGNKEKKKRLHVPMNQDPQPFLNPVF